MSDQGTHKTVEEEASKKTFLSEYGKATARGERVENPFAEKPKTQAVLNVQLRDLLEIFKGRFQYFRHLTALATGSILLEIAFIEKAFSHPLWKPVAAISLGSLLFRC